MMKFQKLLISGLLLLIVGVGVPSFASEQSLTLLNVSYVRSDPGVISRL